MCEYCDKDCKPKQCSTCYQMIKCEDIALHFSDKECLCMDCGMEELLTP